MKNLINIFAILSLTACSTVPYNFSGDRMIAEENSCEKTIAHFLKNESSESDLNKAFKEKKLISFSDKIMTVNYPKIDWLNKTKKSLINRMKNWNQNKYPVFYMDMSENFYPMAKSYADLLSKEVSGAIDDEGKKNLELIREWISSYKNYGTELDNIIEERISMQYNYNILKDIKLTRDEVRDIKLLTKKDGIITSEVITLRDEDKNLTFVMKELKEKIKIHDGKGNQLGKVEERVVKQAMSRDMVTIIHRELESIAKNSTEPAPEIINSLSELEQLLKNQDLSPSSFGVYKISNQVFSREVADLFHHTKKVKEVSSVNHMNVRNYIEKFFGRGDFKNKVEVVKDAIEDTAVVIGQQVKDAKVAAPAATIKKEGPLKRIYTKIATFTPYQKFAATTKVGVLGYGAYRFFWFKGTPAVEVTKPEMNVTTPEAPETSAHAEQLDQTAKLEQEKSEGHSSVVEVEIKSLIHGINP